MKLLKKRNSKFTFLFLYFIWSSSALLASATWWLLTVPQAQSPPSHTEPKNPNSRVSRAAKDYCNSLSYLKGVQRSFCEKHPTIMKKLSEGVHVGIHWCQYQFRYSRWNCTVYPGKPRHHAFDPILKSKGREKAFVYAIIAASVSYEVTRACTSELLPTECSCKTQRKFEWNGCSDDIKFGDSVSRSFFNDKKMDTDSILRRHNREAGRRVVINNQRTICKCHGLSGGCSQIVCWESLPTIEKISDVLKEKYDGAVKVRVRKKKIRSRNRKFVKPTEDDLVYVKKSPTDFCDRNLKVGSFGTQGRRCNASSLDTDGCSIMCCGRRYETQTITVNVTCNCRFTYCCKLDCQTCSQRVTESFCM